MLPKFKYHPDPIKTGSIILSDNECVCCSKKRGYIYTGPCFSEEEYDAEICPWCIADGKAYEELGIKFNDEDAFFGKITSSFGGKLDEKVIGEIVCRTPGFNGWQQEYWFKCCNDAATFIGRAGYEEMCDNFSEALDALKESINLEERELEKFLKCLSITTGPTAYVFKCLHCGAYGAYQDCC